MSHTRSFRASALALAVLGTLVAGQASASGFQLRDEVLIEGGLKQLQRRYDPEVEKATLRYALKRYYALPAAQRVAEFDAGFGASEAIASANLAYSSGRASRAGNGTPAASPARNSSDMIRSTSASRSAASPAGSSGCWVRRMPTATATMPMVEDW